MIGRVWGMQMGILGRLRAGTGSHGLPGEKSLREQNGALCQLVAGAVNRRGLTWRPDMVDARQSRWLRALLGLWPLLRMSW